MEENKIREFPYARTTDGSFPGYIGSIESYIELVPLLSVIN